MLVTATVYAQPVLKIGVLGAMSGPAKYWGLTSKYCALTTAKIYNDQGGVQIGNRKYRIEVSSYDTRLDKDTALLGAQKLIREHGIHYLIGPNIDDTSLAIIPLLEANNVINIAYGFNPLLFSPPRENTYLGMMHPKISAPVIYRYLKENHEVRTVAFLARRDRESINQRNTGIQAAEKTGLEIRELEAWDISEITYPADLQGVEALIKSYIRLEPDLVVLSGAAPLDTPKLVSLLRNNGYSGFISTETAQEPALLLELLPGLDRFVSLGSSPGSEIHTDYMKAFAEEYKAVAGQWHDEAGVKVYALELILRILQTAGEKAIEDIEVFKEVADRFTIDDPFYKREQPLKLVAKAVFGHNRQINVPLTIQIFNKGTMRSVSF
ncbi:MAG: ABC transporter substrate-binding protein [Ketobacteraceae bacterium]|nr:ABC transporter substrate-binding protein [Ketobacteraceae bacterium]